MSQVAVSAHAPHPYFEEDSDYISFGGRSILELAQKAERTPFYAYSTQHIADRISFLRRLISTDLDLHYSVKANPLPALVRHVSGLVDGLDVASGGELKIALETGIDPAHISFAGPGKRHEELAQAVAAGVTINIESETELQRIANLSRTMGRRPLVAVRVNPAFELRGSGMKMAGGAKPFGVDADKVPDLLRQIAQEPIEFVGFHIFSGSQNLNAAAIIEAHQSAVSLALELAHFAPSPIKTVAIGGGFGIPYFPGEQPLNVPPIATELRRLSEVCRQQLGARLVVELGRYLVGEAGLYVCSVVDRKVSRGKTFLITDGGLHHHLAASGNFGQILRRNYPVLIGNRPRKSEHEQVTIVGPLCTPLDIIADQVSVAKASIDDLVVVLQSGAYGMTASPLRFLSHPPPVELLV